MTLSMSVYQELRLVGSEFARALMELAPHLTPIPLELETVQVIDPTRGFLYRIHLDFLFVDTKSDSRDRSRTHRSFQLELTMMGTSIRRVRGRALGGIVSWADWAVVGESPKSETSRRQILTRALEACGLERSKL